MRTCCSLDVAKVDAEVVVDAAALVAFAVHAYIYVLVYYVHAFDVCRWLFKFHTSGFHIVTAVCAQRIASYRTHSCSTVLIECRCVARSESLRMRSMRHGTRMRLCSYERKYERWLCSVQVYECNRSELFAFNTCARTWWWCCDVIHFCSSRRAMRC